MEPVAVPPLVIARDSLGRLDGGPRKVRPEDRAEVLPRPRAPDGAHFCPGAPDAVRGVTSGCPVWSSGAFRFGTAMATPVLQALVADRQ